MPTLLSLGSELDCSDPLTAGDESNVEIGFGPLEVGTCTAGTCRGTTGERFMYCLTAGFRKAEIKKKEGRYAN
jgi:hypothetical protein